MKTKEAAAKKSHRAPNQQVGQAQNFANELAQPFISQVNNFEPPANLQRKCACGSSCPACQDNTKELIQPKLTVGQADDKYEQEADRVAAQVIRPQAGLEQHGDAAASTLIHHSLKSAAPIQRMPENIQEDESEEATVQPKREFAAASDAPPNGDNPQNNRHHSLASGSELMQGGSPLPFHVRRYFETRFGRDFSQVRVHTGSLAHKQTRAINARAFTYANHLWFGHGYRPEINFLTAHELTHVVQQTSPKFLPTSRFRQNYIQQRPASLFVQRQVFWNAKDGPTGLQDGTTTHEILTKGIKSKNKGVREEVQIPNANRKRTSRNKNSNGSPLYGFADLYRADPSKEIGVVSMSPWGTSTVELGPLPVTYDKAQGKVVPVHTGSPPARFAPYYDPSAGEVKRMNKAPTKVEFGEIKPANNGMMEKAKTQMGRYQTGVGIARTEVNRYQNARGGQTWGALTFGRLDDKNLTIPDKYEKGDSGKLYNLAIGETRIGGGQRKLFDPKTELNHEVKGRLMIRHYDKGAWGYYFRPTNLDTIIPAQKDLFEGAEETKLRGLSSTIQNDIAGPIFQAPTAATPFSAARSLPAISTYRPSTGQNTLVQRKKQPKVLKDNFVLSAWNTARGSLKTTLKAPTGDLKKGLAKANFLDKVFDADKDLKASGVKNTKMPALPSKSSLGFKTTPKKGDADSKPKKLNFSKIHDWMNFWNDTKTGSLGFFRDKFGGVFVKVSQFYHKVRQKFQEKFKGKSKSGGFGKGIMGAAIKVVFNLLKIAGGIVAQRTAEVLTESLIGGVKKKLDSLINPDTLLDTFLDPEKRKQFDEKIAEIKKIAEDIEKKATDTADQLVESILSPFEKHLKKIDSVRQVVSDIAAIVKLVRWGARVIACLSPPGWGCLWILAESVIEHFAALVIETCWFMKKITPKISGIGFIKNLPKKLAGMIIKLLKEKVLPPSLQDVLLDPETITVEEVKKEDIDCNESGDGAHKMTPERKALMEMQERLGEEKFKAFMRLVMKAGVPSNRQLSLEEIRQLEKMLKETDLNSLKRLAHNYKKPKSGKTVTIFEFLEKAKKEKPKDEKKDDKKDEQKDDSSPPPEDDKAKEDKKKASEEDAESKSDDGAAEGKDSGPKVVDGDKSKLEKAPAWAKPKVTLYGLVLNPKWGHKVSSSKTYKVDIRYYKESYQGEAVYLLRNAEVKVLSGGRKWWPNEKEKKELRITYTLVHNHCVETHNGSCDTGGVIIFKGGNAMGIVDHTVGN